MIGLVFLIVGIIQLGIAIRGTIETQRKFSWYSLLILIVVYGLAYENIVISIGQYIGEGTVLQSLNWVRFAVHALFTPTLMISAFGMLKRSEVKFAQNQYWHGAICTLSLILILLGSYDSILKINLVPVTDNGVLRYVNDFEFIKGPPLPAVLTIILVLISGNILWRKIKWAYLFLASIVMFVTAALPSNYLVWQNIGEVIFAGGLVLTEIHVISRVEPKIGAS